MRREVMAERTERGSHCPSLADNAKLLDHTKREKEIYIFSNVSYNFLCMCPTTGFSLLRSINMCACTGYIKPRILRYLPWSRGLTNLPRCDTRIVIKKPARETESRERERERKPAVCTCDSKICLDHSSRSHSEAPFFTPFFNGSRSIDYL